MAEDHKANKTPVQTRVSTTPNRKGKIVFFIDQVQHLIPRLWIAIQRLVLAARSVLEAVLSGRGSGVGAPTLHTAVDR